MSGHTSAWRPSRVSSSWACREVTCCWRAAFWRARACTSVPRAWPDRLLPSASWRARVSSRSHTPSRALACPASSCAYPAASQTELAFCIFGSGCKAACNDLADAWLSVYKKAIIVFSSAQTPFPMLGRVYFAIQPLAAGY